VRLLDEIRAAGYAGGYTHARFLHDWLRGSPPCHIMCSTTDVETQQMMNSPARNSTQIQKNRDLATTDVAAYIDTFYNRTRRYSHLGGLSPEQFEAAHKPPRRDLH
jgi:hypothetical protein